MHQLQLRGVPAACAWGRTGGATKSRSGPVGAVHPAQSLVLPPAPSPGPDPSRHSTRPPAGAPRSAFEALAIHK